MITVLHLSPEKIKKIVNSLERDRRYYYDNCRDEEAQAYQGIITQFSDLLETLENPPQGPLTVEINISS